MLKAGNKHPLKECLGENSGASRVKRGRFDNVVLLNEVESGEEIRNVTENNRPILRAGKKRKRPSEGRRHNGISTSSSSEGTSPSSAQTSNAIDNSSISSNGRNETIDENDIISELTNKFKKARLRPVFFTISSFIEQTVDEVGFTMADEPETEVTIRINFKKDNDATTSSKGTNESGISKEISNDGLTHTMFDNCTHEPIESKDKRVSTKEKDNAEINKNVLVDVVER